MLSTADWMYSTVLSPFAVSDDLSETTKEPQPTSLLLANTFGHHSLEGG